MTSTAHPLRRRLFGVTMITGLLGGAALIAAAAPAQAVPGTTVVSTPSISDSNGKSVTANCPAGTVVYGASARIANGGGKVLITDMVPTLTSVRAQGAENDVYGPDWVVIATAICAPDNGHNVNVITAPSVVNGSNVAPRSTFPTCLNGQTVFGAGFKLGGASGNVDIVEVEPNAGLTQVEVEARADNGFNGVFDLFGYAICGNLNGSTATLLTQPSAFGAATKHEAQTGTCPVGSTVTGVGGKVTDNTDGILLDRFEVTSLLNRANTTGWDNAGAGVAYDVTAFAICLD
ncbi:MAG TPA: hypothetical protein VMU51_17775 [Mycobacteriales bacterium]|nr:hypothetical protein [Mycobacteriales bacterium]